MTTLQFLGDAGQALSVVTDPPVQFSAHRFTVEDLDAATHPTDLPRRDRVFVHLDRRHTGVGDDIGWGRSPHDANLVRPATHRFAF